MQIWNEQEIQPSCEYRYDVYVPSWSDNYDYIDYGDPSLSVLINRCQNLIHAKYYQKHNSFMVDDNVVVYMNQNMFDIFLALIDYNYKDFFIIEIDESVQDSMVIIATLDKEFIESVQIK